MSIPCDNGILHCFLGNRTQKCMGKLRDLCLSFNTFGRRIAILPFNRFWLSPKPLICFSQWPDHFIPRKNILVVLYDIIQKWLEIFVLPLFISFFFWVFKLTPQTAAIFNLILTITVLDL